MRNPIRPAYQALFEFNDPANHGKTLGQWLRERQGGPMLTIQGRKVIVSRSGIAAFNRQWPCSSLRSERAYWFDFDEAGDLVDTDCPEQDDGPAASALADDCRAYLFDDEQPQWMEG